MAPSLLAASPAAAGPATAGPATAGPATAGPAAAGPAAAGPATSTGPGWLREVNTYRRGGDVPAVRARAAWVAGIRHHLRYMARTPPGLLTGTYANLHRENPRSPYYTRSGAREAAASDLSAGMVGATGVQFIDVWLTSPFHAIGMLSPQLRTVAFASNPATGDAGLDIIRGLVRAAPDPRPVLFPGPRTVTSLRAYSGAEHPNPLQTCHWTSRRPRGLPIVALLPAVPSRHLAATIRPASGRAESTAAGTLCLVDQQHYHSTNRVYGPTGRQILAFSHAVVLIPRHPLRPVRYQVTIRQPGRTVIRWAFTVR